MIKSKVDIISFGKGYELGVEETIGKVLDMIDKIIDNEHAYLIGFYGKAIFQNLQFKLIDLKEKNES